MSNANQFGSQYSLGKETDSLAGQNIISLLLFARKLCLMNHTAGQKHPHSIHFLWTRRIFGIKQDVYIHSYFRENIYRENIISRIENSGY